MKEKILELRAKGKTYQEIVQIIGCSKASVSYHCSEKVRQNFRDYRNKNRKKCRRDLKEKAGGRCCICGYNKCFTSLSFHHKDPSIKDGQISDMMYTHGKAAVIEEIKKCILVCTNCHGEIHEGLIKVDI